MGDQRFLRTFAVGKIPRHFGVASDRARIIANRGENNIRPKTRAIPPHPPGLFFHAPAHRGQLQQFRRPAPLHILMRKETREVHAHNLVRAVLLDPLRAGIPGHHESVQVKHVDRIVAHAFDNRPQVLIVAPQRVKRRALFRHIAHKAQHHRAGRGLDRLEHDVDRELASILAQPKKIHGRTHLPRPRMGVVILSVTGVLASESLRNQALNRQPQQFRLCVTK